MCKSRLYMRDLLRKCLTGVALCNGHLWCRQCHLQNKLYIAWNMFNLTILDMKISQIILSHLQLQRDFWLLYGCSLRLLHDRQINSYQRYLSHRYRLSASSLWPRSTQQFAFPRQFLRWAISINYSMS